MATLNNGSSMTGDITLTKKSGTILTLSTDDKYVDKDIQFTLGVQSAALSGTSGSADADVESTDSSSVGGVNISGVIGDKTTTEPSSGYYIRVKATGSVTPNVSTAGWLDAGELPSASATATKFFPVTGATVTQNAPTVNTATGVVTATTTTTAGYTPANATAASNTLQLSTQAAKTVSPTESEQTAVAAGKYTTGIVKVGAISSTYVGSGIPQNDSDDLSVSGATVTAPAGYYADNATATIPNGTATTPATTVTANPSISVNASGLITATASATKSVTPTVSAGYVATGTAGTITVSGSNTSQLSTQAGKTVTPTESEQTAVASGKYTTGAIKVGAISSTYVGSAIDQNDSDDLTVSGATVTAPAGYYAEDASASVASGAISASVSSNTGGSASMSASGFTAASGTTGYYVNLATTAGSVKAKATVGMEGYVTSSDTTETAATSVAVSGNGNKLYIPTTGVTASVSSNTGGSASMAATGFTPLSSGTSSYYVTLSTSAGSVKAKAVGNGTGMISSSTSNETSATSVAVSGNGNKVYIPATGVTASVSSNTGGSASMAATGMTPLSSGTSSYYVTLSTSAGSVKAKAVGNGTGMVTSSTSNETGATSVAVSGNGTKMYIPEATFANTATSGTTYTDKSSTAPVLIAGDFLYINKGYTPDIKISLAKLVPDGSDVKGHGEYIISGHSAYDNDGTLVAGTIPTLVASDIIVSGGTVTIPLGKYTGASDGTAVSTNVGSGAVTTSFTGDGMSTYFNSGTSSDKNVTITPKYTNTAGYIAAHSTATNNGGTAYYKIKTVSGSIGGSASGGSATAAIANTNSMATITDISGKTAGTDYWQVKATATGSAGSYTPKYTVSTAGWIGSTVTGTAQSVSVSSDSTGKSIYIPKATIAGSSTNATATTTVAPGNVTIANNTTAVSGKTRVDASPSTATTGISTYYIALKANAAANSTGTTSSISGSGSATVSNAGYAPTTLTGSVSVSGTATAKTSSKDSSVYYIPLTSAVGAANTASASIGTASTDSTSIALATTQPSSGNYYTLTASGSGSSKITTAGWIPTGALTAASTTAKYYVTKATSSTSNGTASATANAGTASIAKQPSASATATANGMNGGYYTDSTTSSYYVDCSASAASGYSTATGGSASASVTASSVTVGAGYNPSSVTASTAASSTGNKTGNTATSTEVTASKSAKIYLKPATIAGSSTNATATTTVAPGTVSISKQATPSGVTNAASGNATTTAPSSGVYVAVKATAAANTTGTTSSISGSGTATVTGAGYAPTTLTGTVSVSGTATAKTSAKDSSMTYVPITTATPAFDGGTLSGGSTATGTNVTLSTTDNGMKVQTAYTASSTAVLYNGAVNGWVSKADNAQALAAQSKASTNGTAYYVTAVTMPKDKGFTVTTTADTALDTTSDLDVTNNAYRRVDITNNANGTVLVANSGNSTITSGSATAGNLTVSAYNSSGTAENNKSIVSSGKWVSTTPTAYGTYYGRVTVSASSILKAHYTVNSLYATTSSTDNPATTLGFGTWTKIAPTSLKWNDLKGTTWSSGTTGISNGVYVWKRTA